MNTQPQASQTKVKSSITNDRIENDHADSKTIACEQDVAVLTILSDGSINTCNQAAGRLFGCLPSAVSGRHITMFLPQVAKAQQFKGKRSVSFLRFLSRIGHRFDVVRTNGTHFPAELVFNDLEYTGRNYMHVFIHPVKQKRYDLKKA